MNEHFNRSAEDAGNIIALEHVNTTVPDPSLAHLFYVSGMGFTRDAYIDFGLGNMWVNVGRQQFHLPTSGPQVLRGHTGIVVPSLDELKSRLEKVAGPLAGSELAWRDGDGHLEVTCPWGNRFEVFAPGAFGAMRLGMPYVRFDVPTGAAPGIARFYREVFGAPAELIENRPLARITIGSGQTLEFCETEADLPAFDGHHVAIYIADFSGPHRRLLERGLVTEESNPFQYRFQTIIDPESGAALFEIEHEVRSLTHPLHGRPLINRNPNQTVRGYTPGKDPFPW